MSDLTMQAEPQSVPATTPPRLRLWPGVAIFSVLAAVRGWASLGAATPSQFFFGLIVAPVACLLALVLWWLFASRLRWSDRLLIPGGLIAIAAVTMYICGNNFPPMGMIFYGVPLIAVAWVGWLVLTMKLPWPAQRAGLLLLFVALGAFCSTLRLEGMDGSFNAKFSWRWTPTAEDKLLADLKQTAAKPTATEKPAETPASVELPVELTAEPGDWPDFRGPQRDGRLAGVTIGTNWEQAPPRELWRHRIGPGWSSIAIVGERLYTQEQRGDQEFVVCYDTAKGTELWSHHDTTRFFEVVAGAGPRGTPTFHNGNIYALGANGNLNCLNAVSGKVIWSRDIVADTAAKIPQWGFSSSPLVVEGLVSVFAGGPGGKSVVAYHADTGKQAWAAGEGEVSYCSTQLSKVCGVEQLLITTDAGLTAFQPVTGKVLWHHSWPTEGIARVVQPAVISDTDILIGTGMGVGTRRVHVEHEGETWNTKEVWTVRTFKPYYNDFVVSEDHAYGFDGNIFMCVNLGDGKVAWRTRGYGNGEVLLLGDQKLLLVLTETGDAVLVDAQSKEHREIAKVKVIEGKTWNHPVIAHGKLFARNAEEIACFELPVKVSAATARVDR
ncbi:MAG: repeat-like protein [Planctomycetaceae bacterium]|nr:repeat-like protein [Planctomycetaceae bacterium]